MRSSTYEGCFCLYCYHGDRGLLCVLGVAALRQTRLVASAGVGLLIAFAYLLTLVETEAAGRAYATYGGIYIVASLVWLWVVESVRPDRWDVSGATICLIGAAVILWGPRG